MFYLFYIGAYISFNHGSIHSEFGLVNRIDDALLLLNIKREKNLYIWSKVNLIRRSLDLVELCCTSDIDQFKNKKDLIESSSMATTSNNEKLADINKSTLNLSLNKFSDADNKLNLQFISSFGLILAKKGEEAYVACFHKNCIFCYHVSLKQNR